MSSLAVRDPVAGETDHDVLREHLLDSLGVGSYLPLADRMPDLDELLTTEWPPSIRKFIKMMRNRMLLGSFRYGRDADPKKWRYNSLAGMRKKFLAYEESGNIEHLIDLANYCHMEYRRPSHPRAHFRAEDDHCHCPR